MEVGGGLVVGAVAAAIGLFAKRRPILTRRNFDELSTNLKKIQSKAEMIDQKMNTMKHY